MNKKLLILFLFILNIYTILACDACGSGGFYMGAMPQFNKHFVGFRYRMSSFTTAVSHDGGGKESYQTVELFARFYPLKRLQVMGFLPYSINQHTTPARILHTHGFGDATVLLNYQLWTTNGDTNRVFQHTTFLGGGVKLPTGHFKQMDESGTLLTPTFQTGTGSFDFIFTGQHTIRYKKMGLNTLATYKYNTANMNAYLFGNKATANIMFFFVHRFGKLGIMPNVGLYAEKQRANHDKDGIVYGTSGHQIAATAGLDVYYKSITFGLNYQRPIKQSYADGMAIAAPRLAAQVAFLF